ncbi:MAG: S8 family serine peptidase [Deltaproteobacteria bacterium]|nr:S8 family serine peptidase [Deltaproteobacteria bacterium]
MKPINTFRICLGLLVALTAGWIGCDSGGGGNSYTVSGTIYAPSNTAVDSDTNEINVTPVSNDYFDGNSAQILSKNPVIVGGYANVAYAGQPGNSFETGDTSDVFKVALTANQSVNLYIADTNAADLDLYLYDENVDRDAPEAVASSTGTGASEKVQATSAGTYYVEVRAHAGASNYTLTTGQTIDAATAMDARLQEDFLPGDVVVVFREEARERIRRSLQAEGDALWGLDRKSGSPGGEMVLAVTSENRRRVFAALAIEPAEDNPVLFQAQDPRKQLKLDTLRTIDALKKRDDVLTAEPNYLRHALEAPDDDYYPLQWHYPLIRLPQAWELTKGSSEVIVAVIDTGILANHPDISNAKLVDGYDFISDTTISLDGDGIDPNPQDPGDAMEGGSSFHGTHVAGTIGAATNNGTGVAGVTWNCRIMPLRALGNGGGLAGDIRQAIRYAAGLDNASGITLPPSRRADIINMSLGGSSRSDLDQQAIDDARAQGVIIIAAAGNSASSTPMYPAAYNHVVSVSAVGPDKTLAPYSNFGGTIDVAAPGGDASDDSDGDGYPDGVLSTGADDTSGTIKMIYNFKQGTSMATPHVAGVAALMKSVYSGLTPAILDNLIAGGTITEDLGPPGRDNQFGHGLIDALQAVLTVYAGELPTLLFVDPLSLNFGSTDTILLLDASNYSSETLTDVNATTDVDWISIEGSFDEAGQSGTFTISVDRTGLDDGPYAATITFTSSVNTVPVPVRMQVGDATAAGNAGYHYVVLLDPDTFQPLAQYDVPAPTNGAYHYHLKAPMGKYIIFAGTDADNDYYIGDAGESSGAYPSLDQPAVIRLYRDLTGYDFATSFNFNLSSSLLANKTGAFQPIRIDGAGAVEK